MAVKAIIFDLDGTLVDTAADLANAMNFGLAKSGRPVHSVEACKQMIGSGIKVFAERALGADNQDLRDEVLLAMKGRYHDKCFEYSRLYEGIFDVVNKLRAGGIRLAVLTNKDQGDAERIIEHFFGAEAFEYVVGVVGNRGLKPDIGGTMRIIESMGLEREDFLLVGDSPQDIQTAAAAGIRSVGVSWGFRSREDLAEAGADMVIDGAGEILGLLDIFG
ncbi:MAG: HAD family hydrolase [Planctomycetes bacterium]|nr:HAD family hydrolase [Planctomycetota bacterium]